MPGKCEACSEILQEQNSKACSKVCARKLGLEWCPKCSTACRAQEITKIGYCRKCRKDYDRARYISQRKRLIRLAHERQQRAAKSRREEHLEYLRTNPCSECGERDVCVLELDHQEEKTTEVSNLMHGHSRERYLRERDLTRVLCGNCHRIATHRQFGWWATPTDEDGEKKTEYVSGALPKSSDESCWYCHKEAPRVGKRYCSKECLDSARSAKIRFCGLCQKDLPQSDFRNRQPACVSCSKTYSQEHYRANKSAYVEKAKKGDRRMRQRNRSAVREILERTGCSDCGEKNIRVLEFDHRNPEEKEINVAQAIGLWGLKRLQAEIAKCDVVCVNCHKRRTHRLRKTWASLTSCPHHDNADVAQR